LLYALNREVKSFCDLSHVDYFVGGNILNKGFFTDFCSDLVETPTEVEIKFKLRGDLNDLTLKVHVSAIQEVLNHVLSLRAARHLHKILEAWGWQNLRLKFGAVHASKGAYKNV